MKTHPRIAMQSFCSVTVNLQKKELISHKKIQEKTHLSDGRRLSKPLKRNKLSATITKILRRNYKCRKQNLKADVL